MSEPVILLSNGNPQAFKIISFIFFLINVDILVYLYIWKKNEENI
jgi:hypothetical protein